MKLEYLKSSWFAALLIVSVAGFSGCCSGGRCSLLGNRGALEQEIVSAGSAEGALEQYRSEVVGSGTRTAAVSSGSGTKNCGTG